mmetsp:Transcript_30406/g.76892  ORF Transcript_30406/g.76892 Transcript_30406/m.76892 type:complete len:90 (-) Transcript_30406:503-772(-)
MGVAIGEPLSMLAEAMRSRSRRSRGAQGSERRHRAFRRSRCEHAHTHFGNRLELAWSLFRKLGFEIAQGFFKLLDASVEQDSPSELEDE